MLAKCSAIEYASSTQSQILQFNQQPKKKKKKDDVCSNQINQRTCSPLSLSLFLSKLNYVARLYHNFSPIQSRVVVRSKFLSVVFLLMIWFDLVFSLEKNNKKKTEELVLSLNPGWPEESPKPARRSPSLTEQVNQRVFYVPKTQVIKKGIERVQEEGVMTKRKMVFVDIFY